MNNSIESPPVFFLLIVSVTKDGQLNKIEICLPDKEACIVERINIYVKEKIVAIPA